MATTVGNLRLLGHALAWLVIVVIALVLVVAVLVPRLGGATPYAILTSSMRPHYPPGTLVVVKPVAPADVALGSVITYQRDSGKPDVVTHRVVEVSTDAHGQPRWHTQGDANPVRDAGWIRPVQLKGELWYAVPVLGRVNLLLTGHQRQLGTVVAAIALFLVATRLWVSAWRDHLRSRTEVTT